MMLADRAVLASTLVVAFASGGAVGYSLQGEGRASKPYAVETVFRQELQERRERGYSEAEMERVVSAYSAYLSEYQNWWDSFVDSHERQLDRVDEKLERSLGEIDAAHEQRTDGTGK